MTTRKRALTSSAVILTGIAGLLAAVTPASGATVQDSASLPSTSATAPATTSTTASATAPAGTSALGSLKPPAPPKSSASPDASRQVVVVVNDKTAAVSAAFKAVGVTSARPLDEDLTGSQASSLRSAATTAIGGAAVNLGDTEVLTLRSADATQAAKKLATVPGVTLAEPNVAVSPMNTGDTPLPASAGTANIPNDTGSSGSSGASALPTNYGLTSSLQDYLNSSGVDAMGAYSLLEQKYHQLPGTGEIITNVSLGNLDDTTTVVQNGQRYLDIPSFPLIPTYASEGDGTLDPTGTVENEDPSLSEVLLDFSVMAPLPDGMQRAGEEGSGDTDLLGIAPGAKYRLVVPTDGSLDSIATAMLAAARQTPRPDVITASLGIGTDAYGYAGRYLEDDPLLESVIASIVKYYGITVVIASNDGTRLYTNAAVGPDGGSTPTNVTDNPAAQTSYTDDEFSTTPTQVPDSGAIAAGGTTLDDTLAVPPQDDTAGSENGTWAATRTDGSGAFSSGFGSRIDVSAPSDGIVSFELTGDGAGPSAVTPVLTGGTSAAAPMIAAAAAVVLQAARLSGQPMTPQQVRSLLEQTGRPVATPPQEDQTLHVGPQLDVTKAVEAVLDSGRHAASGSPAIVRVSVAHRETIGLLGTEYLEDTSPGDIDLEGPDGTGEGLVGPVTVGADVTGISPGEPVSYALVIGSHTFTSAVPSVRLTPTQILTAAGLTVDSATPQTVSVTFEVVSAGHGPGAGRVLTSAQQQLTFGPTDGSYAEAQAPVAPATVAEGQPVTVSYNLTGVTGVASPELVLSGVGHWNPSVAAIFDPVYTVPLTSLTGTVTIPASAFDGGAGIYGIGTIQDSTGRTPVYGEFVAIGVEGAPAAERPAAPLLGPSTATAFTPSSSFGHQDAVSRAEPSLSVRYDVAGIPGATGALVEFSAPGPTATVAPADGELLNTVNNPNGSQEDNDGVDSPASLDKQVTGTRGTVTINPIALGLATSEDYNVRVLATNAEGDVVGQASPTSFLEVNDGEAPDGALVSSFAIDPGGTSVAATFIPASEPVTDESQAGQETGSALYDYDPATGTYGKLLAQDTDTGSWFDIFGVDPGASAVFVLHHTAAGDDQLEVYNTATGGEIGTPQVLTGTYTPYGGRVVDKLNEGVVLVHRVSNDADLLLTTSLTTGAAGTTVKLDTKSKTTEARGLFALLDVAQSTGTVYVQQSKGSVEGCNLGIGAAEIDTVDLAAGTVTAKANGSMCADFLAAGAGGKRISETWVQQASLSIEGSGSTVAESISTQKMRPSAPTSVTTGEAPVAFGYDGSHDLALVGFTSPAVSYFVPGLNGGGYYYNNDGTGRLVVTDLKNQDVTTTVNGLYTGSGVFGGPLDANTEQSVQLDPATHTGWTYSPDGAQIMQFTY